MTKITRKSVYEYSRVDLANENVHSVEFFGRRNAKTRIGRTKTLFLRLISWIVRDEVMALRINNIELRTRMNVQAGMLKMYMLANNQ